MAVEVLEASRRRAGRFGIPSGIKAMAQAYRARLMHQASDQSIKYPPFLHLRETPASSLHEGKQRHRFQFTEIAQSFTT
jgi:hypothetical protein